MPLPMEQTDLEQNEEEQKAKAEADARILMEAEMIRADKVRFEAARDMAGQMAARSEVEATMMARISGGSLHYPNMSETPESQGE